MKKVLITGANSYIGRSFRNWLQKFPDQYLIHSISLRDEDWKTTNFSFYDVVFHVAGIAHIKETKKNKDLYFKVNRDLAYEVARRSKANGVKQFIYLSSMSVYGLDCGTINESTPLRPKSSYGKSKLQAEELIAKLEEEKFKIAIVRPPMVYGEGCEGNYSRLSSLALKIPLFPDIQNQRSMIYIGNLCEFIRILINNESSGIFFPQNKEYVCTSEMVRLIANIHGKKIRMTKLFNPIIKKIKVSTINKLFGNLLYEKSMSPDLEAYNVFSFEKSIELTEYKERNRS